MKSVLWFVMSELFSSLKAPPPTVRPIAKGGSHVNAILPNPSHTDTDMKSYWAYLSGAEEQQHVQHFINEADVSSSVIVTVTDKAEYELQCTVVILVSDTAWWCIGLDPGSQH